MSRLRCEGCATTDSAKVCTIQGQKVTLCKRCYCDRTGDAEVPFSTCFNCGKRNDMATRVEGKNCMPKEGDASVCIQCGAVSMFDKKLRLVRMPESEFAELSEDLRRDIAKAQWAIRMLRAN